MDKFFPSPYKIKNPEIRYKYKVFLYILDTLSLKQKFIFWYKAYKPFTSRPEGVLCYFNDEIRSKEGYINKLGGWRAFTNETETLRKVEIIQTFMRMLIDWKFNQISLFRNNKGADLSPDMYTRVNNFAKFRTDTINEREIADFINSFSDFKKIKDLLSTKNLNKIVEGLGYNVI